MASLSGTRLAPVSVSARDRALLLAWAKSRTSPARVVWRSRIVLMLSDGHRVKAVADKLGVAPVTVRLWGRRFCESGPSILLRDAPGRGRKPILDAATRRALREGTNGGDEMSLREWARELGVSVSTVFRWRRRAD